MTATETIYKATNRHGDICHYGSESSAASFAGKHGTVEPITIKQHPAPSLKSVPPETDYKTALKTAWSNPAYGIYDPSDPDYEPVVNLLFERGFRAAWQQTEATMTKLRAQRDASYDREHHLLSLLAQVAPNTYAQQGAEHMLDGFKPQRREPIDTIVEQLKEALNP